MMELLSAIVGTIPLTICASVMFMLWAAIFGYHEWQDIYFVRLMFLLDIVGFIFLLGAGEQPLYNLVKGFIL